MTISSYVKQNCWPIGIVSFFIVLASFYGFFLLPTAFRGSPAKVVADSYQASVRYDDVIAKERRALRLGYRFTTTLRGSTLAVSLQDSEQGPVSGKAVTVSAAFAPDEKLDVSGAAKETAPGVYEISSETLKPGVWIVSIDIAEQEGSALLRSIERF